MNLKKIVTSAVWMYSTIFLIVALGYVLLKPEEIQTKQTETYPHVHDEDCKHGHNNDGIANDIRLELESLKKRKKELDELKAGYYQSIPFMDESKYDLAGESCAYEMDQVSKLTSREFDQVKISYIQLQQDRKRVLENRLPKEEQRKQMVYAYNDFLNEIKKITGDERFNTWINYNKERMRELKALTDELKKIRNRMTYLAKG